MRKEIERDLKDIEDRTADVFEDENGTLVLSTPRRIDDTEDSVRQYKPNEG